MPSDGAVFPGQRARQAIKPARSTSDILLSDATYYALFLRQRGYTGQPLREMVFARYPAARRVWERREAEEFAKGAKEE